MKCPAEPNTMPASCDITVGKPTRYGAAWVRYASPEMPATSVPRIRPSIARTRRALMPSGGLNALTAVETDWLVGAAVRVAGAVTTRLTGTASGLLVAPDEVTVTVPV